jgi:hypothetical protein
MSLPVVDQAYNANQAAFNQTIEKVFRDRGLIAGDLFYRKNVEAFNNLSHLHLLCKEAEIQYNVILRHLNVILCEQQKLLALDNKPEAIKNVTGITTFTNRLLNGQVSQKEFDEYLSSLPKQFGEPNKINHARNICIALTVISLAVVVAALLIPAVLSGIMPQVADIAFIAGTAPFFLGLAGYFGGMIGINATTKKYALDSSATRTSLLGIFAAKKEIAAISAQPTETLKLKAVA